MCLSSFVISEIAVAQSIAALLRDTGTSGDIRVCRGNIPHSSWSPTFLQSKVQTRTSESSKSKILYHSPPENQFCCVVFFFPLLLEDYHQIPSIIFISFLWHITSDLFCHTVPLPSNHHLQIPHVLHGENSGLHKQS